MEAETCYNAEARRVARARRRRAERRLDMFAGFTAGVVFMAFFTVACFALRALGAALV